MSESGVGGGACQRNMMGVKVVCGARTGGRRDASLGERVGVGSELMRR